MTDAEKAKAVKGAEAFFDGEGTDKSEDEGDQIQNTKEAEEEAEEDTEKDGTCVSEHEKHQHDADEVDNNACNGEDDKEKHEGSDAADKDEDHDSEEDVSAKEEVQKDELSVEESEDEEEGQEEQGTVDKELTNCSRPALGGYQVTKRRFAQATGYAQDKKFSKDNCTGWRQTGDRGRNIKVSRKGQTETWC